MTIKPANLVIFGATGDLSKRMLLPSLYYLDRDGLLPDKLSIIGAARSGLSEADFIALARKSLDERVKDVEDTVWQRFSARLGYCKVNADNPGDLDALGKHLKTSGSDAGTLFFLFAFARSLRRRL